MYLFFIIPFENVKGKYFRHFIIVYWLDETEKHFALKDVKFFCVHSNTTENSKIGQYILKNISEIM